MVKFLYMSIPIIALSLAYLFFILKAQVNTLKQALSEQQTLVEMGNAILVGYLTDITELKNSELRLKHLSQTDQLTNIPNRMYIDTLLQKQYYYFLRNRQECSIILMDLDHFKSVNDKYGHIQGDAVLVEFAELVKESIREGDHFARWGGEEFLAVLPHTNLSQGIILARKLCNVIEDHDFPAVKHQTASFGVSSFVSGMSIKEILEAADKALYSSKAKGRNCVT